jgi:hypothetical protein
MDVLPSSPAAVPQAAPALDSKHSNTTANNARTSFRVYRRAFPRCCA